jgi:NAD(P)-dependent dehydrogenase (short-subunit alcohol dehydrogenase family)
MAADYFERSWRVGCFGGFLFGREAVRRMAPRGGGSLFFTGASASLRGRAGFGAFNAAKAGLRALAQAMAKEYARDNIHVAHVVVDGAIAGEKIITRLPDLASRLGEQGMISIEGIVDAYVFLISNRALLGPSRSTSGPSRKTRKHRHLVRGVRASGWCLVTRRSRRSLWTCV